MLITSLLMYIYGTRLRGEAGKEYRLEVIYKGDTITSTTSIPNVTQLDSLWFEPQVPADSAGLLYFQLSDNPDTKNYYRALIKVQGINERYVPTKPGVYNDTYFNGETITLSIARGISNILEIDDDIFFKTGDTIKLKFCAIDEASYEFWNTYQNEIITSANPFASTNASIKSNINNGFGI